MAPNPTFGGQKTEPGADPTGTTLKQAGVKRCCNARPGPDFLLAPIFCGPDFLRLDDQIFDTYLANIPAGLSVRLLAHKHGNLLKPAIQKFSAQHGNNVAVRVSPEFHDRIVFVDDLSCWVMGQSIKDAAKAKPTYLLPLSADIAKLKLSHYETIWNTAAVL